MITNYVCKREFFYFKFHPVIRAAHNFYNATTSMPMDKKDLNSRKRITSTLNRTINPEEKRKIIGDTFMKVRIEFQFSELFSSFSDTR